MKKCKKCVDGVVHRKLPLISYICDCKEGKEWKLSEPIPNIGLRTPDNHFSTMGKAGSSVPVKKASQKGNYAPIECNTEDCIHICRDHICDRYKEALTYIAKHDYIAKMGEVTGLQKWVNELCDVAKKSLEDL